MTPSDPPRYVKTVGTGLDPVRLAALCPIPSIAQLAFLDHSNSPHFAHPSAKKEDEIYLVLFNNLKFFVSFIKGSFNR